MCIKMHLLRKTNSDLLLCAMVPSLTVGIAACCGFLKCRNAFEMFQSLMLRVTIIMISSHKTEGGES